MPACGAVSIDARGICEVGESLTAKRQRLPGQLCRRPSVYPRQNLLQRRKELRPAALGALVELGLIRREA
jgi:hypothetical protein